MNIHKQTGEIEKTYEGAQIEWRIPDFSTIAETQNCRTCYDSPVFSINGVSCHLELFPRSSSDSRYMRLFIRKQQEYSLEYDISLKKLNGNTHHLVYGVLEENKEKDDVGNIIKMSEIIERKDELTPENALTLLCKFKRFISCSIKRAASDSTVPLKFIRLDKLSENFKKLFGDYETCDTTLKVKDKEYKAHKLVLIARSPVFAAAFQHDTLERQTGVITITDCDPDSFALFLEYVYSGRLEELSVCSALHLHYICDKYDVQELKTFCLQYLMQNLTVENICEIAAFADKYDITALFTAVQNFFNENVEEIFAFPEWKNFMKNENDLANKLLLEMSKAKNFQKIHYKSRRIH